MPKWVRSSTFRIVIVFTMALGMLLSPIGGLASHNPIPLAAAEAARHAELAALVDAHGHAHDDGVADEQMPGHAHGHNPADHTHETANANIHFAQSVFPIGRMWHAHPLSFADFESDYRLERPPRPILIA